MICGGILGGVIGLIVTKKISSKKVPYLFMALMVVIIGINLYNVVGCIS